MYLAVKIFILVFVVQMKYLNSLGNELTTERPNEQIAEDPIEEGIKAENEVEKIESESENGSQEVEEKKEIPGLSY